MCACVRVRVTRSPSNDKWQEGVGESGRKTTKNGAAGHNRPRREGPQKTTPRPHPHLHARHPSPADTRTRPHMPRPTPRPDRPAAGFCRCPCAAAARGAAGRPASAAPPTRLALPPLRLPASRLQFDPLRLWSRRGVGTAGAGSGGPGSGEGGAGGDASAKPTASQPPAAGAGMTSLDPECVFLFCFVLHPARHAPSLERTHHADPVSLSSSFSGTGTPRTTARPPPTASSNPASR